MGSKDSVFKKSAGASLVEMTTLILLVSVVCAGVVGGTSSGISQSLTVAADSLGGGSGGIMQTGDIEGCPGCSAGPGRGRSESGDTSTVPPEKKPGRGDSSTQPQ
jgi:hypothetical protein